MRVNSSTIADPTEVSEVKPLSSPQKHLRHSLRNIGGREDLIGVSAVEEEAAIFDEAVLEEARARRKILAL